MSDWSLPTLTSLYTAFLTEVSGRLDDAGKQSRSDTVTLTSPPVGHIRWNTSTSKWETNTGTVGTPVWTTLAATYGINVSTAAAWATGRTITLTGDATAVSGSWTGSSNISFATTLATVNGNVGAFGSTSAVPVITVNAKGLITAVSTAALGNMATQAASAVAITGGAISATAITLPSGTGPTTEGLVQWNTASDLLVVGTGAATKTMVDLNSTQTLTGKTLTSPTLTTPALGVPISGTLTNATGLPIVAGTTGTLSVARGGTGAVDAAAARTALSAAVTGANGDITSMTAVASMNAGPLGGLRNMLINGNMGVSQRGTTAVTTTLGYGPADRWQQVTTGNTFSASQGSFVSGDTLFNTGGAQYFQSIAVTSVAGVGNATMLQQKIEDVRLLAGKTVTVSFWAKAASGTPSIGINCEQMFGTGGSADVQGTGQAQALTTTWTRYSKTFSIASISGKTLGATNTSYTNLIFWLDAGSNFNARAASIGQATKTVSIAQVQLEIGSVATEFEHRPVALDLAMCQRYYFRTVPAATKTLGAGYNVLTTAGSFLVPMPVTMRIAPTALEQSGSGPDYHILHGNSTTICSAVPVFGDASEHSVRVSFTVASGLTAGQGSIARTQTAAGYLGFSSEL